MDIEKLAIESGVIYADERVTYWTDNNAIEVLYKFAQAVLKDKPPITDIDKLKQAQSLLSDVYDKYGKLLTDNYSITSQLSCADGCIIDAIDWLTKFKEEIGNV